MTARSNVVGSLVMVGGVAGLTRDPWWAGALIGAGVVFLALAVVPVMLEQRPERLECRWKV